MQCAGSVQPGVRAHGVVVKNWQHYASRTSIAYTFRAVSPQVLCVVFETHVQSVFMSLRPRKQLQFEVQHICDFT